MIEATEAAEVVEAIADSLRLHPQQFQIEVSVTGQTVSNTGPGIGLSVTAVGGAPGSRTIGQQVTVDGAQVDFSAIASQGMNAQTQTLETTLRAIAAELREAKPDRPKVSGFLTQLRGAWVPDVITGIVTNLVSRVLGI